VTLRGPVVFWGWLLGCWIPAFAGMTEGGVAEGGGGMVEGGVVEGGILAENCADEVIRQTRSGRARALRKTAPKNHQRKQHLSQKRTSTLE